MTTQMYTCTYVHAHYIHVRVHVHVFIHFALHIPEPLCSVIDSWARGIVPQVSGATEEDTTTHPPLGTSRAEDEVQCTVSTCTC